MILYHSAFVLKEEDKKQLRDRKISLLRSYHSSKNTDSPSYCKGLFLDSGAFSAFNSGAIIDFDKYIDFLLANGNKYTTYASLDVIGNPKATWRNQIKMEKAGLSPIPTFHINEPFAFFEQYLERYNYIALGGMVGVKKDILQKWLDFCWQLIKKYPGVRIHGFGMTDFVLMNKYPWYSIDSTTASRAGRTGVLLSPWGQLRVSSGIKTKSGATVYTPKKIERLLNWMEEFIPGMVSDWESISSPSKEASQLRCIFNVLYLEFLVENSKQGKKTQQEVMGFFK